MWRENQNDIKVSMCVLHFKSLLSDKEGKKV